MKYFLGLDAGGTKTFCLIADAHGNVCGFGRAGTGNYEHRGVEAAEIENRAAVQGALDAAGITLRDVAGVGLGVAGADLPEDYEMLEREVYTPLFGDIPRVFRNDSMGGLRGGTRYPFGIVIACGTGCVCAGVNQSGEETRVGGLGAEFGDRISGTDIGRDGLRCVWRARDNIIPPTLLSEKFLAVSGCADIEEFFLRHYRQEITLESLQPMAKVVCEAAYEGDAAACCILKDAGDYLGMMVNAVARRLAMTRTAFEVVMAGSVFKGRSPVMIDAMRTRIHEICPDARLVMPMFEPVVGTLLMAMETDLTVDDALYLHLREELKVAESTFDVQLVVR